MIASSIASGARIAAEVEKIAGVEVFVVLCNAGMRPPITRWMREVALLLKSLGGWSPGKLWRDRRAGKLLVLRQTLDDPQSTELIRSLRCDVGLHAANVIYREPTISAFRLGILNAHIGVLPQYRGRSVAEWSVLQGDATGVTVFFIDSGIDTGERIVVRELVPRAGCDSVSKLKRRLFARDAISYRKAIEALMSPGFRTEKNDTSKGLRYFVMSKLLTQAVTGILRAE